MNPESLPLAGRYEMQETLARGGMASVYRVRDTLTRKTVALKQLTPPGSDKQRSRHIGLFEQEFHTLSQLAHPRIVQVYDYGIAEGLPYYTMELLDGGDLEQFAPMAWPTVCSVAYDVCSALSLLHSRRLIHRDLSPRNIRRTADGTAKLIDFGLLSTMGPRAVLGGTPPYVAPEVLENVALDGRADLFSLGGALYYALTGRLAYPARGLQHLPMVWRYNPPAPSQLAEVPPALDALVLSLIRLEAGARPKSAAEVMTRLLPLLGDPPVELKHVSHAYLSTPILVGRDSIVARLREEMTRAFAGGGRGIVFAGPAGIGRSRMLDAFALEAKLLGATTLRSSAAAGGVPFGVAAELARQLHECFPEESTAAALEAGPPRMMETPDGGARSSTLIDLTRPDLDRTALQHALRTWFLTIGRRTPLAIAVDDLQDVDEPSAALLATLAVEAPRHRYAYAATVNDETFPGAPEPAKVLCVRAESFALEPLSEDEVKKLLRSVFGDVPHLQLLSHRLHGLSAGRPRECMALARMLVDNGSIIYNDGVWVLPPSLDEGQLPATIKGMLQKQVSGLTPLARRVVALLGLGLSRALSRSQLLALEEAPAAEIDQTLAVLLSARVVTGNPESYRLGHDGFARLVLSALDEDAQRRHHKELASLYERSGAGPILAAYHDLRAGEPDRALLRLLTDAPDAETWEHVVDCTLLHLSVAHVTETLELALAAAEAAHRPARDLLLLRERLAHTGTMGDAPQNYYRVASACLQQYKIDSGFYDWQALDAKLPAPARAQQAITAALARYHQTPEVDRVLSPIEAIGGLVRWVAISLPVACRVRDLELIAALPPLLEPFVPIDPRVAMIAKNARASWLHRCAGRWKEARELWMEVLCELDSQRGAEMPYAAKVRTAICCTIGILDASLGFASSWERLLARGARDPQQLPQIHWVKRLEALYSGDWDTAQQERQQAELAQLRAGPQQPLSTLIHELDANAAAENLTGLKEVRVGIHRMAARHKEWTAVAHLADAHYDRQRGDPNAALIAVDRALHAAEQQSPWHSVPSAAIVKVQILLDLGRADLAVAFGEPILAQYREAKVHHAARELACALSVAEARLGRIAEGNARVVQVIAEQEALGIRGLHLGLSYRASARIAIAAGNPEGFVKCSALMAESLQAKQKPGFGALCEHVREEARAAGVAQHGPGEKWSRSSESPTSPISGDVSQLASRIDAVMANCRGLRDRAASALRLLCDRDTLRHGCLFLMTDKDDLVLAASTVPQQDLTGALNFAKDFLRKELESRDSTLATATYRPASFEEPAPHNRWQAPDGSVFTAVLLSQECGSQRGAVGVALLYGTRPADPNLFGLVSLLAARLTDGGPMSGAVFS